MRSKRYILHGHIPVIEPDLRKWAEWYENVSNRIVRKERIGSFLVNTIFLGIDHDFGDGGTLLFETMVFDEAELYYDQLVDKHFPTAIDEYTRQYSTWNDAEAGHQKTVDLIRRSRLRVVNGGKGETE
jgi:hypothetical protein